MKKFLKFTFSKLITTIILIVVFVLGRRLTALAEYPNETIFFKFDDIIFKPVYFISSILKDVCQIVIPGGLQNSLCDSPNIYSVYGFSFFVFDILEYYILACLFIYISNKIIKKLKTKESKKGTLHL